MSGHREGIGVEKGCFSYRDKPVFKDLNLVCPPTVSMISIIGPSGAGKSTVLKILGGLLDLDEGTAFVDGRVVKGTAPDRAYVFQDHNLLPWKNVAENVEFGLVCMGWEKGARRERVREMLELFDLADVGHLYPHQLSGGMSQRVGFSRALVLSPSLLLLDEPVSSLDEISRFEVLRVLAEKTRMKNARVVSVMHDLSDAVYLSERVAVMRPGREVCLIDIDLPPPPRPVSIRYTPAFGAVVDQVRQELFAFEERGERSMEWAGAGR